MPESNPLACGRTPIHNAIRQLLVQNGHGTKRIWGTEFGYTTRSGDAGGRHRYTEAEPLHERSLVIREKAFGPEQFGLVLALGLALIVLALVLRLRVGQLGAGFAAISFLGLTWIYVLSVNELPSYLRATAHRVVVSLVVGVAALSPLLVEECARALAARRRARAVGTQL